MRKQELKLWKKYTDGIFCYEFIQRISKTTIQKAWENASFDDLLDIMDVLEDLEEFRGSGPLVEEFANYYKRCYVAINLSILNILFDNINLECPEREELIDVANKYIESGDIKDFSIIVKTSDRLRARLEKLRDIFDGYDFWTYRNILDLDSFDSVEVFNIICRYNISGLTTKERYTKGDKFLADLIRDLVDPPTLEEFKAIYKEWKENE